VVAQAWATDRPANAAASAAGPATAQPANTAEAEQVEAGEVPAGDAVSEDSGGQAPARRRWPAKVEALRDVDEDGRVRLAPQHPYVDQAVCVDPAHRPAGRAAGVDGKERRGARRGGQPKVHLLGVLDHRTGMLLAQRRVTDKTNEVTHLKNILAPLPLAAVVLTADAMQTTRENARFLVEDKHAHYLLPVLGNQPGAFALLDALDWAIPVVAATQEYSHGRIETRTLRVQPAPDGLDFTGVRQVALVERHVTEWKKGAWHTRTAEAVLYVTSLAPDEATPPTCSPSCAATGASSTPTGYATSSGERTSPCSGPATAPSSGPPSPTS
jgi:hypothetical protein